VRRTLGLAGTTITVLIVAAVVARLYLTDERLRRLAVDELVSRADVPASIERLHVSILDGLEVGGLRVGPPQGFALAPIVADRLALHWSFWDLLRLRVVIDELAIEGLHVALEEGAHGRNLDVILARLTGPTTASAPPAVPAPPPPSPPAEPTKRAAFSLPLRIEVRRIAVEDFAADVVLPGLEAHADRVNVEGSFAGAGQAIDLDLWMGLGERAEDGASSHVRFVRQNPPADVDATLRFGLHVVTAGLGDVRVEADLSSRTYVAKPYALPALDAAGKLRLAVDLLQGKAQLGPCVWSLGHGTRVELTGWAADLLAESPRLRVDAFTVDLDFHELSPLIGAVMRGTSAHGRMHLALTPFDTDLKAVRARWAPTTSATLTFDRFAWTQPGTRVDRLDGSFRVDTRADLARFESQLTIGHALSAGQAVEKLTLGLDGSTPITPFIGAEARGELRAHVKLGAARAGAPAALARGVDLELDLVAPTALVLARPDAPPLDLTLRLAARAADTPTAGLEGMRLKLRARSFDLAGRVLEADLRLDSAGVWTLAKGEVVRLPGLGVDLGVGRRSDDYDLRRVVVTLGSLMRLDAHGAIAAATSPAPRFRAFAARLTLPSLGDLLALAPASLRPPLTVSGSMSAEATIDGVVDQQDVIARLHPPKVTTTDGDEWRAAVQAYATFIATWATWFEAGLPFVAHFGMKLDDVAVRDDKNELRGLDLDGAFDVSRHGPRWHLAVDVAEVKRPTPVTKGHFEADFTADRDAFTVSMAGNAESISQQPLTAPLSQAQFAAGAHYRLGGDLVLDVMRFTEAAHGLRFDMSGVVTKPFAIALERGWSRPGMPGVDVTARFGMGYGVAGSPVTQVTDKGPGLGGIIGVDGTLRIADGLVGINGRLSADRFGYEAGPTSVAGMSGSVPFDLQLYGGRREDAVVVARTGAVGGGVLSLVVADGDVRERPSRPLYYDRLAAYRPSTGLAIAAIRQDAHRIDNFRVDGRVEAGMFVADAMSMSLLGGDVTGSMALQLARDTSLRGDMSFQTSHIDASYFEKLKLQPGPESELNADMRIAFLFAPKKRDLTMVMNVTKIGATTFDRLLQLLDPASKNGQIQSTRDNLGWMRIDELAIWIRYESLNMDLSYNTKLGIPGTHIGYRPVEKELLRRYSLSENLDAYLQPSVDKYLAKPLGWTNAP
jgi:hypothetical protein